MLSSPAPHPSNPHLVVGHDLDAAVLVHAHARVPVEVCWRRCAHVRDRGEEKATARRGAPSIGKAQKKEKAKTHVVPRSMPMTVPIFSSALAPSALSPAASLAESLVALSAAAARPKAQADRAVCVCVGARRAIGERDRKKNRSKTRGDARPGPVWHRAR